MNPLQLLHNLNTYLMDPNPACMSLLVSGEWGSGKSYFMKNKVLAQYQSQMSDSDALPVIWISLAGLETSKSLAATVITAMMEAFGDEKTQNHLKRILKTKPASLNSLSVPGAIYIFDDLERCLLPASVTVSILSPIIESGLNKVLFVGDEARITQNPVNTNYFAIKEKAVAETLNYQPDLKESIASILQAWKPTAHEELFEVYRQYLEDHAGIYASIMNDNRHRSIRTFQFFLAKLSGIIQAYLDVYEDENLLTCLAKISDDLLRICILQREGRSTDRFMIHDDFCLQSYMKEGDLSGCMNRIEAERRIPQNDPLIQLKEKGSTLDEDMILNLAAAMKEKLTEGKNKENETETYPVSAYLKINELYSDLDYLGMSEALEENKLSLNALMPVIELNIQDKYANNQLDELEEAYADSASYAGRDNDIFQFTQSHTFIREKIADAIQKIYRQQLAEALKEEDWGIKLKEIYESMGFKNYFFALLRPAEWTSAILKGKIQDLKDLCSIIDQQAASLQAGTYGGEFKTLKDIRDHLLMAKPTDRMQANAIIEVIAHISSIPGIH